MTEEVIDLIEENATPIVNEMEIEITESIGWAAADTNMHSNLPDRNAPNQHLTSAITGLDEQLAQIKAPRVLYSNKSGVANYYEWESGAYDEAGYFVSLVPGSAKIKICDGTNIFGVTVEEAGFVGNQGTTDLRGNNYGLVATSGLVDVRCTSGINEGAYVVANKDGLAVKTNSDCGYKVISKSTRDGTEYVSISLGVQACTTDAIGQKIQSLDKRLDDAEINISAIALVADEANSKAQNTENKTAQDLTDMSEKVNNANFNASNALLFAQQSHSEAQLNHKASLEKIGELEKSVAPITTWKDPNSENVGADYFATYMQDGLLSTQAELKTVEKLDEENRLLIEKNAETYQQTISSVDKYVIGEYSQAYGLSVEQAKNILKEGMVYIPTKHGDEKTHTEIYSLVYNDKTYTYQKDFTEGFYYTWSNNITLNVKTEDGEVSIPGCNMWNESVRRVCFLDLVFAGHEFDFWYTKGKLYKLMAPEWQNIDKFVYKGASEPTKNSFAYWFDGSAIHVCMVDDESKEVTWVAKETFVGTKEPADARYEFWCCENNIYKYTDAIWTEFDQNVWYGELDATASEYNYCFYNNTLCVRSLSSSGEKYWQPRSTYVGEEVPSYTTYDFWYDGKKLYSLWREVNTLAGNVNSRLTSSIRQDVDQIAFDITNGAGCMAGFNARLTDTEAKANMGTFWVDPVSGEQNMANVGLIADDDGSSMSFVVRKTIKNADGELENEDVVVSGAGITLKQGEEGSSILIEADCINFEGDAIFETDEESGQTHIKGGFIKTGNLESTGYIDGETYAIEGTSFSLDDGTIKSKNFAVDEDGKLHAKGADIDGTITARNGKIGQFAIEDGYMKMTVDDLPTNLVKNSLRQFYVPAQDEYAFYELYPYASGSSTNYGWIKANTTYTIWIDLKLQTSRENVSVSDGDYIKISTYDRLMTLCNIDIQQLNKRHSIAGVFKIYDDWISTETDEETDWNKYLQDVLFDRSNAHIFIDNPLALDYTTDDSLWVYEVRIVEGNHIDDIDVSGLITSNYSSNTMNWSMNANQCAWWNQEGSETEPLMKLDKNGLYVMGEIESQSGHIGDVSIQESGLCGHINGSPSWILNNQGLYMPDEGSIIQVGNFSLYNTENTAGSLTTRFESNGRFKIQASSGAYIILDDETGTDRLTVTINLYYKLDTNGVTYIYATASQPPRYDINWNVSCKAFNQTSDGEEWSVLENTVPLKIVAGSTKSSEVWVTAGSRDYFAVHNSNTGRYETVALTKDDTYRKMEYLKYVSQDQSSTDIKIGGNLIPSQPETYNLGLSDCCWNVIYSKDGTVSVSDGNKKNTVQSLEGSYDLIFDSLKPVSYKFNENTSNRTHIGFIAQDVKNAVELAGLTTQDFAGYCEWEDGDGEIGCGLRYGEFVSLNTWQIQKLKARVSELEAKLNAFTEKNN